MKAGYDDTAVTMLDSHGAMLRDRVRIDSFMRAIMAAVNPGDVVVDIGTGTGVLALFAVKAGARRVYAIEQDQIIDLARDIVNANGYEDRVVFVPGNSTDIELPDMGDLLATETIGNAAFDEGIIQWIGDARERLLKPDASVIPGSLGLMTAALELPRYAVEMSRWTEPMHSLDFSPVYPHLVNTLVWDELSPVSVVSEPVEVYRTDFTDEPVEIRAQVHTAARRDATIHAVGLWFVAELWPGITLTNAPPSQVPSWNQGVLMLEEPIAANAGATITIDIGVTRGGAEWSWQVNDGARQTTGATETHD